MRLESKNYLHQDPWAPLNKLQMPGPILNRLNQNFYGWSQRIPPKQVPWEILTPSGFWRPLGTVFLKQRCMYLGLIIEFTGNMNRVVVLICAMTPRAWSWASSGVAPGQLFGKWAGEQQAAPTTYWLSKTSATHSWKRICILQWNCSLKLTTAAKTRARWRHTTRKNKGTEKRSASLKNKIIF